MEKNKAARRLRHSDAPVCSPHASLAAVDDLARHHDGITHSHPLGKDIEMQLEIEGKEHRGERDKSFPDPEPGPSCRMYRGQRRRIEKRDNPRLRSVGSVVEAVHFAYLGSERDLCGWEKVSVESIRPSAAAAAGGGRRVKDIRTK